MDRSSGVRVKDADGNAMINGAAGLWCASVGHGRQEIVDAIAQQAEKMAFVIRSQQFRTNRPSDWRNGSPA